MIDNIKMRIFGVSQEHFDSIISGLNKPLITEDKGLFDYKRIKADMGNMKIHYYPNTQQMEVRNSVHKLYNTLFGNLKPDNSTDFTYSNFCEVCDYLANTLLVNLSQIEIEGRFEFGVNIETGGVDAYTVCQHYQSYNSGRINPFVDVLPVKGKPKFRVCSLSDYRFKTYYKNRLELKAPRDLIRFEIVTTELRMLRKVTRLENITLADLKQKVVWQNLMQFLLNAYGKIQKIPLMESKISIEDLNSMHQYCNWLYHFQLKTVLSQSEVKRLRKKQKEIYDRLNKDEKNKHVIIQRNIENKLNNLILS